MKAADTNPVTARNNPRISQDRNRNRLLDIERLRALPAEYDFQDEIDSLADALYCKVTRAYPWPRRSRFPSLAKTYRRRIIAITDELNACENFSYCICTSQVFLCGDFEKYQTLADELTTLRAREISALAPAEIPGEPLPLRGHLFELPPEELHKCLDQSLSDRCRQIYQRLFSIIILLRDNNIVGRVKWNCPDVCEFQYSLAPIRIDELPGAKHETKRRRTRTKHRDGRAYAETEIEQITNRETLTTHFQSSCLATLVGARCLLFPGPCVPKPSRLKQLFEAAPASLHPYLHVVDGLQTYYRRIDMELDRKKRQHVTRETTFESLEIHLDPCLAIGPKYGPTTALVGWSYDDFGGEKAYFKLRRQATRAHLLRCTGLPAVLSPFSAAYRLIRSRGRSEKDS